MGLLLVEMLPGLAFADVSKKQSVTEIITKADVIVYGNVISMGSYWNESKILTKVDFNILTVLKGKEIKEVSFEYIGGTALHPKLKFPVTINSPGNYELLLDNKYVLMLTSVSSDKYKIIGSHGVFNVYVEDEAMYVKEMKKIHKNTNISNEASVIESKNMTLAEFKDYINRDDEK